MSPNSSDSVVIDSRKPGSEIESVGLFQTRDRCTFAFHAAEIPDCILSSTTCIKKSRISACLDENTINVPISFCVAWGFPGYPCSYISLSVRLNTTKRQYKSRTRKLNSPVKSYASQSPQKPVSIVLCHEIVNCIGANGASQATRKIGVGCFFGRVESSGRLNDGIDMLKYRTLTPCTYMEDNGSERKQINGGQECPHTTHVAAAHSDLGI
jgi:hypothetical protein